MAKKEYVAVDRDNDELASITAESKEKARKWLFDNLPIYKMNRWTLNGSNIVLRGEENVSQ